MADFAGRRVVLWRASWRRPRNRIYRLGTSNAPDPVRGHDGTPSLPSTEQREQSQPNTIGGNPTGHTPTHRNSFNRRGDAVMAYFMARPGLLPFLLIVGFVEALVIVYG